MKRRALMLAAHGSRHEPAANALLREWAGEIERRGEFDHVVAAFHQGEPRFCEVLDTIESDEVVVVPVMTSQGYYCDEFLPAELKKNAKCAGLRLTITPPVGVHPDSQALVAMRLDELARRFDVDPANSSVAIVGHGTKRNPKSSFATEQLVDAIRRTGQFADVAAFFLEEEPGIEQIPTRLRHQTILVEPFLISGGHHAIRDIPERLGIEPADKLPCAARLGDRTIAVDSSVGTDFRLIEVIESLALHAIQKPPLRLGTRGSRLARWQAQCVADLLRARGTQVEIVDISTLGDRVQDRPIGELGCDDPFSADIEAALEAGAIDFAVHSMKDLPVDRALDEFGPLGIAAVLPRGEVTESLVSHDRRTLRELPPGAVIGTSSPRRAAQLLAQRPDLVVKPIRGAVDDRVRQVMAGRFDAAILATAGLARLGLLNDACEEFSLDTFVPAPAQGAMAIQVRRDDAVTWRLCAELGDAVTRKAVTAELTFLRPYEHDGEWVAAAIATVEAECVTLQARLVTHDGQRVEDVRVSATYPLEAAAEVLRLLALRVTQPEESLR
ncbi:hydroxymethylbilane synthase [cyanobacterium TDX16]|nr:hydroxymethylbilane synthase [cyanobacterium TDX16]